MDNQSVLRQRTLLVLLVGIALTVGILLGAAMERIRSQNEPPRLHRPDDAFTNNVAFIAAPYQPVLMTAADE